MAKRKNDWMKWLMMVLVAIVGIGVGGLFINGTFLSVIILSYLPQIIHTIVGWALIIGSLLNFVMGFKK